eukprot:869641-Rhodomonas_salina.4
MAAKLRLNGNARSDQIPTHARMRTLQRVRILQTMSGTDTAQGSAMEPNSDLAVAVREQACRASPPTFSRRCKRS